MNSINNDLPRVLVISHNAFSYHDNNGSTLNALFSKWDKDKISELYFYPEEPNSSVCYNYFRITDGDIIRGFNPINKKCGGRIKSTQKDVDLNLASSEKDKEMLNNLRKKNLNFSSLIFLLRDFLWGFNFWKTPDLKSWLSEFKPEVIFVILANKKFSLKIAYYISKKLNIPIVVFATDDRYRIDKDRKSPIYYLERLLLRNTIKKMFSRSSHIITVSEKMEEVYSNIFNTPISTIFTPVRRLPLNQKSENKKILVMRYIGNLWLGRWRTLEKLCLEVMKVNNHETKVIFEIYSSENNPNIIKRLNLSPECKFMGEVPGEEVPQLIQDSDVVVHAEDFTPSNVKYTELSLSTKISEYLGAGKCILAIGPNNIASMIHVKDAAKCVYDINNIYSSLKELSENQETREMYQKKAIVLAEKDHDSEKNHQILVNILSK